MVFNTIGFAVFFTIVFITYWSLNKKLKFQNLFLLACSYFFYSCWDWRFLSLLLFSTSLDFFTGKKIFESIKNRKLWLCISITINLGFLFIFKYFNFFIDSFYKLSEYLNLNIQYHTLNIVLPIGISFYTFHGLSYVIDIYKRKISVENDFIKYSLFVSFFPLLVAGPIARANHFLPQISKQRIFNYELAVSGMRQILWGLFKKMVIADNCAIISNEIFENYTHYSGSTLLIGTSFFAFQIYGDFSGYSDIAIGTAKLLGFELQDNFLFPYFSRNIGEFWRRWHISLSSWFRDYVYIPLGGNQKKRIINVFIVFLLSGIWHGANWTFIWWGLIHAIFYLLSILNQNYNKLKSSYAQIRDLPSIILTFCIVLLGWIFFRSPDTHSALEFIRIIFSKTLFIKPAFGDIVKVSITALLIIIFIFIEWIGRKNKYAIEQFPINWKRPIRWGIYYFIILLIIFMGGNEPKFIYFNF